MSFPVYLQDITRMSAFRKDGHPSVYARVLGQKDKHCILRTTHLTVVTGAFLEFLIYGMRC
ncbi:hypothetical protein FRX31_025465 [Thalictrum thalictroides]|uniref:Uncharacterized protein n=1 Tax=Thalictrum thalictroides TaxID=46969 RepID=A0A7J6VLF3_THATH|nr:hypothetical protein FRX31_025465 [Thalictrum thalictroides]